MKRTLPFLAALAAACSPSTPGAGGPDSGTLTAAASTITAADLHDRIAFLASDALRGRDTPSPGLDSAAHWVARELAEAGLRPAGEDGWFQWYPYPARALDGGEARLEVSAGATHAFEYGRDYFARPGAAPERPVEAVWIGDRAPDAGAVRGRAVIAGLEGLPEAGGRGLRLSRATERAARELAARAAGAGAVAVLFVMDERLTVGEVGALAEEEEAPRRALGGTADPDAGPARFYLTRGAAARLLRMAGLGADGLPGEAPVLLPGVTLRLAAPARGVDEARAPNVVGVLPGSDPELRDTYVVLSAHMDHVGVGRPDETGDSIYNGADDDASGTAVMLEVAEAMASLQDRPRRSLLVLAVSGEEKGLLGSRWFVEHPTVPIESVVANINLDMVGRNAADSIVVIGQDYSTLGELVMEVAARHREALGLTVSDDPWPEERFFFRSDHFNFAREEVPALFFFAGTHEDYHRPGDEVDKIDADKAARVGRLVFLLAHEVADDVRAPEWDREGLETVRELTGRN